MKHMPTMEEEIVQQKKQFSMKLSKDNPSTVTSCIIFTFMAIKEKKAPFYMIIITKIKASKSIFMEMESFFQDHQYD